MPPDGDSYACPAAVEGAGPRRSGSAEYWPLELRLRVDPQRSDAHGWVGALEVARAGATYLRMPIALAPGQPLFWALSCSRSGALTLRAAPAGYWLASASARVSASISLIRAVSLGADAAGGHPLNGLVAGGRLVPRALSLAAVERLRAGSGSPP